MPFKTKKTLTRKVEACKVKRFSIDTHLYDEWVYMNCIVWFHVDNKRVILETIEKTANDGQLNYLLKAAIKYYANIDFGLVIKQRHFDQIRALYDSNYFKSHIIFDSTL